ncbi:MAG: translation elongation factor Ts [Spirochaetia bacterium]|nr:translation elongation factor Ts [Spirochaetia bacterium]
MAVESEKIKQLRIMTSAGMLDCKKALEETGGDIEKAAASLREKGIIKAVKKMDREANEGRLFSYVHHNGKLATLVELNCETDFVAKNESFQELGKNIAMHIAASNPLYVDAEQVPKEDIEKEKEIQKNALENEGKPANVIEKILEGKINKYIGDITLLGQSYVKEPSLTIADLIKDNIAKLGENISVGRFTRYSI